MIPSLVILPVVHLVQFVHGIQTNSTTSGLPQPIGDGMPRTVWGILGGCAVTLLICIWHAIHFDIRYRGWDETMYNGPVGLVLWAIFGPEVVVSNAVMEWWAARRIVAQFRAKEYEWSMTHCFFAEMGGFAYRDEEGRSRAIDSLEFLRLCQENKIANPLITVQEIRDKSKSDALAKAIFVVQLLWFVIQVVARGFLGLAVTLIELDTVSMATLALLVLWFWWDKPHSPKCPHVFYSPHDVRADPQMASLLKKAWKPEPSHLSILLSRFGCVSRTRSAIADDEIALIDANEGRVHPISNGLTTKIGDTHIMFCSLSATWLLLGGLHLIAWDFHFPTETEKILWRVASLILTGGPIIFFGLFFIIINIESDTIGGVLGIFWFGALAAGILSRAVLIALMLANLRALPPSAYETIAWTAYIPHL